MQSFDNQAQCSLCKITLDDETELVKHIAEKHVKPVYEYMSSTFTHLTGDVFATCGSCIHWKNRANVNKDNAIQQVEIGDCSKAETFEGVPMVGSENTKAIAFSNDYHNGHLQTESSFHCSQYMHRLFEE